MPDSDSLPAWARPGVYPAKPEGPAYGALSRGGRRSEFESFEALAEHVRSGRPSVAAVWTPVVERMVPPEAVPDLLEPLRQRFVDLAEIDASNARRNSIVFGVVLAWALYAAAANRTPPQESVAVGLSALLLVAIGLIPWYDAWKNRRQAWELNEEKLQGECEEARFDYWLDGQSRVLTCILLGLLALAGAVQIWIGLEDSSAAAGLDKAAYRQGEWWRLFTAPFLHGHALHWAVNAWAFWLLGRRVEALAGWPHLALVFLASMLTGGIVTAGFLPTGSSLGASGGVVGLMGFLLAFETLHPRLVPHSARRRILAAVILTLVIGQIGYRFIDNWAHVGGLIGGALYALIVFPRSKSARRPQPNRLDRAAGVLAAGVLTASVLLAIVLMLAFGNGVT